MRLLHTADWHLGKRLFGIDRLEEARAVLAEVRATAAAEAVDAVLVAGDLFDRRLVEPATLGACLEALESLAEVAPVVAVTGNHEDPAFWGHLARYLAPRIVMVGQVRPPEEAVLTLDLDAGPLHVACLPWPDPARLSLEPGAAAVGARGAYADQVGDLVEAHAEELRGRRRADGGAAVLLGHLMVDGALAGGGERELTLGLMYAVRAGRLPQDLDYVALGHVHRAQRVPGLAAPGRYAGSPLALDFSEHAEAKSVAVVDLDGDGASVRELALDAGRSLARIRGPLDALPELAAEHPGAFLFCEVELERPVLDLVREVRERVPDALRVEPRYASAGADGAEGGATGGAPRSLVEHYADWHVETGRPLDREVVAAFDGALRAAERG